MDDPSMWLDLLVKIGPLLIKGYKWLRNRIKWQGISKDARKIAFAINSFSYINIYQELPTITNVGSIERHEINDIRKIWKSKDTPIILHGEAGSGKSGIAIRLGQTLANEGTPVLFIHVTDFPYGQDPVSYIQHRMPINTPLIDSLATISKEKSISLIVDQIDSVAGTDLCKYFISFIKAVAGIPNVKILVVSRSYEFLNDISISSLDFQSIESGLLSNEQSLTYLSQLKITKPSPLIFNLSRNLLNLSLIADVLTETNTIAILSEIDLWKKFFLSVEQREGEEVADFILKLARKVASHGERSFYIDFPSKIIRRKLLSRGVITESPGRRYTFRHERLQNFLCAYSLLPEQLNLIQILNEFNNNFSKNIIIWIQLLYHEEFPELEAKLIDDVFKEKTEIPFYTRASILDNLKKQTNPTEKTARVFLNYINEWSYQRYFFESLDNPAWIIPLFNSDFFHFSPNPIEVLPGSFQIPDWPAGRYLAYFADQYEEIVIDVIKYTETENWRVQEILVDALIKISPSKAAELVSEIDGWLTGRFSGMLPIKLSHLSNQLIESNFYDAAIKILEYVVTPVLATDADKYIKYRSPVRFRSDHYWVNEYCEKQIPKLLKLNPLSVVSVFERQLEKAIEITKQVKPDDADRYIGYYWRMDIPNRLSERDDADALDVLIDGLRDSLIEISKSPETDGQRLLESYLNNEQIIFKRLAMHTLRIFGKNYPNILNSALKNRELLENGVYFTEYRGLLKDQFNNASEVVRTEIISWILEGPLDIEERVLRHALRLNREVSDEDRNIELEEWKLYNLEFIRPYLSGEPLSILIRLSEIYGKPNIDLRPHVVTTTLGGAPSSLSAEDLADKSFEEIKQYFKEFNPEDLFLNPRESLAQTFEGIVKKDVTKYIKFAKYLEDPDIRFVYTYHFLLGLREGLKNNDINLIDGLIELCEFVVSQEKDPFEDSYGNHESGLRAAQLETAHLLEVALYSSEPYLTREQLDQIRTLLITLSHHNDPAIEDDATTGFSPFNHSLNCVRGMAIHGILQYSLYVVRREEKLKDQKLKIGFLEPKVKEVLEEKLDLTSDPSLAVHSVFGAFIPQLYYLAPEWVKEHLSNIFPEENDKFSYWKAAWDAYVFASNVYKKVFELLIPQYQRGLKILSQPQDKKDYLGGSPNDRLAQHIMFAYLNGLTEFNHENGLLDLFFENAPDIIRANGISWLSEVLDNNKPNFDDDLWEKCWFLWQTRLGIVEDKEISENTHEISEYMRWLKNCPVDLKTLFPILFQSIPFLYDNYDLRILIEFVADQCDDFPLEAVTILRSAIYSEKEPWWRPKDEDEEKILNIAMKSNIEKAINIAVELINHRGEQGDFRWKDMIFKAGYS